MYLYGGGEPVPAGVVESRALVLRRIPVHIRAPRVNDQGHAGRKPLRVRVRGRGRCRGRVKVRVSVRVRVRRQ